MRRRIAVIGSGFGGLAAACRLAAAGHEVEIFEARDKLGGRAYVYEQDGFRFDGGPTIITAPFLFDELFALAGRRRSDYVEFVPCDPFYRIFDAAGRHFDYSGDEASILDQIGRWSPGDRAGYRDFIRTTKAIFDKGFTELADKPFLRRRDMLRVAPDLLRLGSYRSVFDHVSRFVRDPFLRRCFSFHPLLVGGNPFDASSIYSLIHYLEREWGVHYAMGGTGRLVEALGRLFIELGGTIHLEAEVAEILIEGNCARGVRLHDGGVAPADVVVSNADVAHTYLRLVPAAARRRNGDRRIRSLRYSMSLFVIYFGTRRRYRDVGLAHHNIILGPRYRGLLEDIFHNRTLAEDFSLYLHMPTITDESLAPPGGESFYVLSPVPNLSSGIDWRETARPYRDAIMRFLEERYLPDLEANLATERWIDPRHFEGELKSFQGAAFGPEPLLSQSAWFRPHNRSEDIPNLYLVGAGTHPGAGLPGVLSSARIAADLIGEA